MPESVHRGWIGVCGEELDTPYRWIENASQGEVARQCEEVAAKLKPDLRGDYLVFMRDADTLDIVCEIAEIGDHDHP